MRALTLWAARHAPVTVVGTCYGRSDVPVARPADEVAAHLSATFPAAATPAILWSSPSERCRRVAELLATRWGVDLRVDEALYELDFGRWEGRTWTQIEADEPDAYWAWMREWQAIAPPGGERPSELVNRVERWVGTLPQTGDHALIAHAGVVRALRVASEGLCWDDVMRLPVEHLTWNTLRLAISCSMLGT